MKRKVSQLDQLVHNNKQLHMKVQFFSFHLNGHTLGYHPQIKSYNHLVGESTCQYVTALPWSIYIVACLGFVRRQKKSLKYLALRHNDIV